MDSTTPTARDAFPLSCLAHYDSVLCHYSQSPELAAFKHMVLTMSTGELAALTHQFLGQYLTIPLFVDALTTWDSNAAFKADEQYELHRFGGVREDFDPMTFMDWQSLDAPVYNKHTGAMVLRAGEAVSFQSGMQVTTVATDEAAELISTMVGVAMNGYQEWFPYVEHTAVPARLYDVIDREKALSKVSFNALFDTEEQVFEAAMENLLRDFYSKVIWALPSLSSQIARSGNGRCGWDVYYPIIYQDRFILQCLGDVRILDFHVR